MKCTHCLRNRRSKKPTPINTYVHWTWRGHHYQWKICQQMSIEPSLWDARRRRAKTGAIHETVINTRLTETELILMKIFSDLSSKGAVLSPRVVRAAYEEVVTPHRKPEREPTLFERYEQYRKEAAARLQHSSLQIHQTVLNHLKGYETKYGVKLTFASVNVLFFDKWLAYLTNVRKLNNVTAWKMIKTFRSFLRHAFEQGYTDQSELRKFSRTRIPKGEKTQKVYLTPAELQSIMKLDLSDSPALDRTRDLYIFQAHTGMRYGDVQALRPEHIIGDEIAIITGKNRKAVRIPILPPARAILEKYNNNLPKISTQKQNDHLPEVARKAGITRPIVVVDYRGTERIEKTVDKCDLISTHSAKRSFATLSRRYGVSIETIMKITGNCRATIESYLVGTEDDALDELRSVWSALSSDTSVSDVSGTISESLSVADVYTIQPDPLRSRYTPTGQ